MSEITRVGVDLAKRVIQVHAVNAAGRVVVARALARDKFVPWCAQLPPGCLVAMEACSGAHHWARKLQALGLDARLVAANFVTPYRMQGRSGKNDANDAAAICEAASRPSMRFVPVKSVEQQSLLSIHRLRQGYKEERTACINRIRGLLAEFGLVFPQSPKALREVMADVVEDAANELGYLARLALQRAHLHWLEIDTHIAWCDERVDADRKIRSAPTLMAYVGLVPGEHSSGPKRRQGSITKAGNSAARRMLVEVACHYQHPARITPIIATRQNHLPKAVTDIAWAAQLRLNAKFRRLVARRVMKTKAVVAVARELAGFVWAIGREVQTSGWQGVPLDAAVPA